MVTFADRRRRCCSHCRRLAIRFGCGWRGAGRRCGAAGCGRGRRRHRGRREMACGRPHPGGRASAVVVVRVAQRGVGHLRRNRRRAVVRPRRQRHTGDEPLAARAGREDRPRRLVRDVLAARGRPGDARRGRTVNRGCVVQTHLFHDRIMRMDTVVLEDGATLGTALRRAARREDRRGRHRRPGVAGDARRRGAADHPLAGQSDCAVDGFAQEARRTSPTPTTGPPRTAPRDKSQEAQAGPRRSSTRTCRTTATAATGCRATNWNWSTRSPSTGWPGRRRSPR